MVFLQKYHIQRAILVTALFLNNSPLLSAPSDPFLFRNNHFFQLETQSQYLYERASKEELGKSEILKGETGLCGLFAVYNGHCLLNACDNPSKAKKYLANLTSIDAFHRWIEKHEATLQRIKNKLGRIGTVNNVILNEISQATFSPEQLSRICIFDYYFVENRNEVADSIAQFADGFKNSRKPYLAILNLKDHWITLVYDSLTTWVMDSCNLKRVTDIKVLDLDQFMRKNSAYTKPGYLEMILTAPRKIISQVRQYFLTTKQTEFDL